MPWSQTTLREHREEFVRLARQPDANVSELCRRFGISRKTGYKWLGREDGQDRSRRPDTSPTRTPAEQEAQIVAVRAEHPAWGARKIACILKRDHGVELATSTVNSVLQRNGLIKPEASRAATAWQRFEHDAPNALWQIDFKGHFPMRSGRCHPLTVLDDHSRFNIVLKAMDNERRAPVQQALQAAFERYGMPERINADNGSPWGSSMEGAITGLGVWLIRLGVRLSHSRPLHPQTNGKEERFHRTLKAEVLQGNHFDNLDDVQSAFVHWRNDYNLKRPHEAIGMLTPADRYKP
ncbi:MAG: IS481 family transposase, partial [Alphaproteobacteria bacterium]